MTTSTASTAIRMISTFLVVVVVVVVVLLLLLVATSTTAAATISSSSSHTISSNNNIIRNKLLLSSLQHDRHLALGDFDNINQILSNQEIEIPMDPPVVIEESGITMTLTSMMCTGFGIGDVNLQWNTNNNNNNNNSMVDYLTNFAQATEIPATLDVIDFDVTCHGAFDFDFFLGSGQGLVQMDTLNSDATIGLRLATTTTSSGGTNSTTTTSTPPPSTFATTPPTILEISSCQTTINVDQVTFELDGFDFVENLANSMDLSAMLEGKLGEFLCDFVQQKTTGSGGQDDSTTAAGGLLESLSSMLDPYLSETTTTTETQPASSSFNPMAAEAAVAASFPAVFNPIQFLSPSPSRLELAVQQLLDEFSSSSSSTSALLQQLLGGDSSSSLLNPNENGQVRLDISSLLDIVASSGIQEGEQQADDVLKDFLSSGGRVEMPIAPFGNVTLELNYIALSGLQDYLQQQPASNSSSNSSKQLLTIRKVGNYSLQVQMAVENITIQTGLHVQLVMPPPSDSDSSTTATTDDMSFDIVLELPIEEMAMHATMLMVLDEDEIAKFTLGDMARMMKSSSNNSSSTNQLNCMISKILFKGELIDLQLLPNPMAIGALQIMTGGGDAGLESFSPGLARVGNTVMDMLYAGFGPSLTRAIPNMVQTQLVTSINELLSDSISKSLENGCSLTSNANTENTASADGKLIDFRHFLGSSSSSLSSSSMTKSAVEKQSELAAGSSTSSEISTLGFMAQSALGLARSTDGNGDALQDDSSSSINSLFIGLLGGSRGGGGGSSSNGMINSLFGPMLTPFGLPMAEQEGESGGNSIVKEGELIKVNAKIPMGKSDARLQLEIADLRIDNIDSMGDLSVFNPVPTHGQILNNSMMLGVPPQPMRMSASIVFGLTSGGNVVRNEMIIELNFMASQLIAEIMLLISEKNVLELSIQDILDVECIIPKLLGAPVLNEFGVRVPESPTPLSFHNLDFLIGGGGGTTMNLTCVRCDSPDFVQMSQLLQQPMEQEAAGQQIESIINHLLATAVDGDSSYAQSKIDRYLVKAASECGLTDQTAAAEYQSFESAIEESDSSSLEYVLSMLVVLSVVVFATFVICIVVRWIVTRRHRKWLRTLSNTHLVAVYQAQTKRKEDEVARSALSKAMFLSSDVPFFAKVFIPIVILGNTALFLSGHLSIGGSVRVYVQLAGEELVLDDVYVFSVGQTAVSLWNVGGRALSFLMFLFSMFWPYFKQLITLIVWFLPPRFLSMQRRGTVLLWLDRLAKWSMVDVFVMIVALAAFRISIESPSQPFMPNDIYNINLMVAPMWGLYSNMTAQLVSQVSSHFILMYQRRIEASASAKFMSNNKSNNIIQGDTMPDSGSIKIVAEEKSTKQMDEEGGQLDEVDLELHGEDQSPGSPNVTLPEHSSTFSSGSHSTNKFNLENVPLSRQVFYRAHRDKTDGLVTRRGVNGLVIFGALAIVALTVVGCTLPSFATESQGVLGLMVGLGRGDGLSTTYHSIFSVSKLLVNMSEFLDQTKDLIGLLSISTLFILTTLVVPLALTLAQLFRWFYPFAKDSSALLDIWIEILEAWQYVEVYVVTVLLAVWQLGDISEFMINSECDQFKSFFASMSYFNILSEDEAQCFRMQPTIESGTYILLSATILLAVLRTFLTLAVRQVEYQSSLLSMSTPGMEAKNVEDEKDTDRMVNAIAPFPVLFTDRFRWLLVKS